MARVTYDLDELPSESALYAFLSSQASTVLRDTGPHGFTIRGLQQRLLNEAEPFRGARLGDVHETHVLAMALGALYGTPIAAQVCHDPSDGSLRLRDRADQEEFLLHYGDELNRAYSAVEHWRREVRQYARQINGEIELTDSDGNALTGIALRRERARIWNVHLSDWSAPDPERSDGHMAEVQALADTFATGLLSPDAEVVSRTAISMLNRTARSQAALFTDGDLAWPGQGANSQQKTALALLETRRQAATQAVRVATAPRTVFYEQRALLEGVTVEDSPIWRTSADGNIDGDDLTVDYPSTLPSTWSHNILARNSGKDERGPVSVEPMGRLESFRIGSALRAGSTKRGVDVTISTAPGFVPQAGTAHVFALVARNSIGPRTLTVTVRVPPVPSE